MNNYAVSYNTYFGGTRLLTVMAKDKVHAIEEAKADLVHRWDWREVEKDSFKVVKKINPKKLV